MWNDSAGFKHALKKLLELFFSMFLTVTVFHSHSHSFVKLVRFEAPVLLTNNEAKLQESNHDDT